MFRLSNTGIRITREEGKTTGTDLNELLFSFILPLSQVWHGSAHHNPSTQGAEGRKIIKFKTSLIVSTKPNHQTPTGTNKNDNSATSRVGERERAQGLRVLVALAKDPGCSQLGLQSPQGDSQPSSPRRCSGLQGYCTHMVHIYASKAHIKQT